MNIGYPRGLTSRVYMAVKALMIAEGIDLGEPPSTLEWFAAPDLLTALEELQQDNIDVVFDPGFLVDRERKGTVGIWVRGKVYGELIPRLNFFVGEGDPPLLRLILPEHKMMDVDPEWLSQWLVKEDAEELRASALALITAVRQEVGPDVSVEIAPILVLNNQKVRSGVIRFSVIAEVVDHAASVAHIGTEGWTGREM